MEFSEVIRSRVSVRSYKPDPVEPEKLQYVLEAARLAPTAVNYQAFKVIVAETAGRQTELQKIYGREWFIQAPYILCVCSIPGRCWVRKDQKSFADIDAAIVMDHIILAATDQGLGTCWVGAFDSKAARGVLGLDDAWEPVVFTPLGYAQATNTNQDRKSLQELVVRI